MIGKWIPKPDKAWIRMMAVQEKKKADKKAQAVVAEK